MQNGINEIIEHISSVANIDFSQYKETTLERRINKRCTEKKFSSFSIYLDYLKNNFNETFYLIQDLLIGVTSFFRDEDVWKYMYSNIFPKLINDCKDDDLRIWIPGCSTGQEAYSMSILITEFLKENNLKKNIRIFATDLNEEKISLASKGTYVLRQLEGLTNTQLEKYFVKNEDKYIIDSKLRKLITFAPHNVLNQPYFKHIDLISCRNLLIYIKPKYQHRILTNMYFSLNENGYLLLGNGDAVGLASNFFRPIHSKNKFYQKVSFNRKVVMPISHLNFKQNFLSNNITMLGDTLIEKGENNVEISTDIIQDIDFDKLNDYGKDVVRMLHQELQDTKEKLQHTIEIYNSTSEEYQATNEELITTNEELESTNQELLSSYSHLEEANLELHNIFKSTNLGILFLNSCLQIKKFTPGVTTYYNICLEDINRNIRDFTTNFPDSYRQQIIDAANKVVNGETLIELEFDLDNNEHILIRLSPYYKNNSEKDGVVINFIDITAITNIKLALDYEKRKLEHGYKIGKIASWEWSTKDNILLPSDNWFTLFGIDKENFEYTNEYYLKLIHPKDIHIVMDIISKYSSGIVDDVYSEYRLYNEQLNDYIWVKSIGRIIEKTPSGEPKKIIGIHHDINSIKKAEQQLFIKDYALNNSIIQIISCNKEGEIVYANTSAKESLGYINKDIYELYYWDIVPNSNYTYWVERWETLKETKHSFYEKTVDDKYGNTMHVIVNENYINYEDQELIFLFIMNITKSVMTKLDLEKSIQRYQLAEELAKVGYLEVDMITNELVVSKGFKDIFHIESDDFSYSNIINRIHPEDLSLIEKAKDLIFQKNKDYKFRFRIIYNNNIYHIHTKAKVTFNNNNAPTKVIVMSRDVTKNIISNQELLASQQKFKSLFDNMPSPCSISKILYNEKGVAYDYVIVDINSAFEKMINSQKYEYIGKLGSEQPNCIGNRWFNIYESVVNTGESSTFDTHYEEINKFFTVNVFKHSDNYFVCVYTDITNRKLYEKEVIHTEKMAAIGQLAGGVAHDFNNQLMGMQGALNLMELNNSSMHSSKYMHMIQNSIDNCTGLVKQLLAFSKKGDYIVSEIDVHDALKKTLEIIKHTVDKKIFTSFDLDAIEYHILGDMSLLESALLNLMINARDAMPNGGKLYIHTYNTNDIPNSNNYNNHIAIEITDTGVGIDKKTLQHIFEPFFTTKGMDKGTGMGLAAVYGTVQKMDGSINVESQPGEGTTFTLFIPTITPSSKVTSEKESYTINKPNKCTILLVDDEPVVRNVLVELLSNHSIVVVDFENGHDAIDFYKKNYSKIDLVMLDMIMPNLNGIEVLQSLKLINPNVKSLLISGFSEGLDTQQILNFGFIGKVNKPFNINGILNEINRIQNLE